ncbi:het domain-containing protein [Fusarium mundagurra]|uniref:Het domain-containing protein n=1 Tax=Fusarium mundagurra TaxID=1567541 RepID=A0A8H5XTC8_9HYPO|nr:het domain-containing protein [Fusarium mundagurra]
MDHLPQLQNRSGFLVEVPFLEDDRFAYDGMGLEGFPERCNVTFTEPHDLQTCWESSKVFQSWLFFGTLDEIFKVYNIEILRDDFVSRDGNGYAIITTKCLQDYIAAWIVSASREYPGCLDNSKHRATAREVGDKIGSVAGQAVAYGLHLARRNTTPIPSPRQVLYNKRHLWAEGRERARASAARIWRVLDTAGTALREFGPSSRGVDAAVWDSVLMLTTTLQTAAFFIYRSIPLDTQFTFTVPFNTIPARLSPQFFREHGWCPREQKIISDLVEGDHCTLLLCSQLDRHNNLNHSNCNADKCEAYQVNDNTYQHQHHQDCHACDFLGFDGFDSEDTESSKLFETIMCNQSSSRPTPMAVYHDGQLRLVPVSVRQLLGPRFVAISHVWADGLGNPRQNALPRCQLERIQVSDPK